MTKPKPAPALFIVDDDQGLLRLTAKTLGREGYSISTAASGEEAVAWLRENQPDLLLLDLKLQDADAKEMIARLTELGRLPPFLIVTGQGDEGVAVEMMKSGAVDYLVKRKDFLELLPSVVGRALQHIEKEKKLAAAEQALLLSEERFRVALKNTSILVFNQDTNLRYTWVHNMPAGWSETHFIGKTDEEIFPAGEADRLTQIKARVLATGTGMRQEVSCTLNETERFYDLTVEAVRDVSGSITGITGAAMEITERKRLEQEVLQISEMEQRRIGQDLHDGICQQLAGIELKSQVLEQNLEKKSSPQSVQAGQIAKHMREAIAQTRSLARSLSPFILESEGLMSALRELAGNTEKLFNVTCRFANQTPVLIQNQTVATHLYRIAQEAVTNAIKHGKAKEIEISLSTQAGQTVLAVDDNGSGFVTHPSAAAGMGLRIMQYRAGMIGATLLIQKRPSGGVTVVCFFNTPTK
jgi:hypothetical protein